jgi:hypothetical protein
MENCHFRGNPWGRVSSCARWCGQSAFAAVKGWRGSPGSQMGTSTIGALMQDRAESRALSRAAMRGLAGRCGVVYFRLGGSMCSLVNAKSQIVREGYGADQALTAGGGKSGTAAVAATPVVACGSATTNAAARAMTRRAPPERFSESSSESEVEPRVTKDGDSAPMVLPLFFFAYG